ncbi:MAG: bifunctional glutamate N-acetyltransferase/amino-acid acetyltransferase ArgJ [Pirellulales bacterium]
MEIHLPSGFELAGVHCGIKRNPQKPDISLIVAQTPAVAAGVYTQNLVVAAPVIWDRAHTPSDTIRVVVTNSGNANACTGEQGELDNAKMAAIAAKACGCSADDVLVMSTGIIGEHLPMEKIEKGIIEAAANRKADEDHFLQAAKGILTTDKSEKIASKKISIDDREFAICGMAKGAGMIGPKMATMLGVILTDAPISKDQAQEILSDIVKRTFNRISVEGHTSTNDTVLMLSSGAEAGETLTPDQLAVLKDAVETMCVELAKLIPADGEGASHLITIDVEGCATEEDAEKIAKTVADSALVKTAVHGGDPNWGRIVSAAGYAGVPFEASKLELILNGTLLYKSGTPVQFNESEVSKSMKDQFETHILLKLAEGESHVRYWASDLTVEYVRFNAEYHT